MKHIAYILIASLFLFSCTNEVDFGIEEEPIATLNDELNLTDGVIIGEKLRNPYSLDVMRQACDLLYPPTRGEDPVSDSLITPNVKYVRFLPTDSTEYRTLSTSGYELFNYPLDYDILGDPSDYHDPNLPPEQITWQYTVMPIDDPLPISSAEVLELGYIPDPADDLNSAYDLEAIEDTANSLVINEFVNGKMEGYGGGSSESNNPIMTSPRIEVFDHHSQTVRGVKGIKVRARNFWKIRTAYTDSSGYYSINLEELGCYHPRFELRFENKYGFKLGYGVQLIMPITANMEDNKRVKYIRSENHKFWTACIINNAAYDWYERCEKEGMPTPPKDLYIWAMEVAGGAACPMFHHKTLQMSGLSIPAIIGQYFGFDNNVINVNILKSIIEIIAPDVAVFGVAGASTEVLYRDTCHELAHATHFQRVGSTENERAMWWADVIQYEVACGIVESPYEATGVPHSGKVGVTEMWAHAVGHICQYEYRNEAIDAFPYKYWFEPEVILELYRNGMSLQEINQSMLSDVDTIKSFKDQLIEDNKNYTSLINKVFRKHLNL